MSNMYKFTKSELEAHMRNKYHPRDYASLPPGQPLGKDSYGNNQQPEYGRGKGTLDDPRVDWLCEVSKPLARQDQCEEICWLAAKKYRFKQVYIRYVHFLTFVPYPLPPCHELRNKLLTASLFPAPKTTTRLEPR